MKRLLVLSLSMALIFSVHAQKVSITKNSYKLLKVDVLNLVGLSVQKVNLGYEFSALQENPLNLPTLQVNAEIPFNSLQENFDINFGLEGGVLLKFYPKYHYDNALAEGFYWGAGIQGGWVSYTENAVYRLNGSWDVFQDVAIDYNRVRTSVYALVGAQANLGSKLYFDMNIGLGWSNVNTIAKPINVDGNYTVWNGGIDGPFLSHFQEGKYQIVYVPISMSIGYNFGSR